MTRSLRLVIERSEIDFPADNNVGKGYNIAKAPLYFVRSGVVRIYQGNFGEGGDNIILWSQTAGFFKANNLNDAHAFQLRLVSLTVNTSFSANRWHGLSLRCLQSFLTNI